MKQLCIGILAHVDAGKTTLSEALLYEGGQLRRLGRVDHRDAFLDTHPLERERGITIFSKQARIPLSQAELTLLDTPGHVDFSAEAERSLWVMDAAILVVSGTDGIQGHTLTLWRLLQRHRVPVFLFLNKMDLAGAEREGLLRQLQQRLDDGCVDFTQEPAALWEHIAERDEGALDEYLERGTVSDSRMTAMIAARRLFPCFFGSALKLDGVRELLDALVRLAPAPAGGDRFGARVFKISRDAQGQRLTWLRVTGGQLAVKDRLRGPDWEEKIDQIRLFSGPKVQTVDRVPAGTVCAVTGLSATRCGQGLGAEAGAQPPMLEPVLTYQLHLPDGCDTHSALEKLRLLEEEDPQLHVLWEENRRALHVQLMGPVQLEILQRQLLDRFALAITFGPGEILYRETIAAPVEGVGHYEPLRHYAEVHLLLEPGEPGSGITLATLCPEDALDRNWQRLILTHLEEKVHLGVLTGSPLTDVRISLTAGRAHVKHTEGGDFRQATYRAVRQGLMGAQSILLEPWYDLRLTLPAAQAGRAMTDLQRMGGQCSPPETAGDQILLTGCAPVAALRDYAAEVIAYTRGQGRLTCTYRGYAPCQNQEDLVRRIGYEPERDVDNPADSVFCSHGSGTIVKWYDVPAQAHVSSPLRPRRTEQPERAAPSPRPARAGSLQEERELLAIFERTYGKVEPRSFQPAKKPARTNLDAERCAIHFQKQGPEYLLVDGYNIIFAWDALKAVARESLDAARQLLMDLLSDYQGVRGCQVILVFDAYRVPGARREVEVYNNIHVVYTKQAETADTYIEKASYALSRDHRVRVATSDAMEQFIILGHGALRVSARAFQAEVEQAQGELAQLIRRHNLPAAHQSLRAALEKAQKRREEP